MHFTQQKRALHFSLSLKPHVACCFFFVLFALENTWCVEIEKFMWKPISALVHYTLLGFVFVVKAGIKFQAAKLHGDVIHCSWLFDCCLQKRLLPLQPKLVCISVFLVLFSLPVFGFPCDLRFLWLFFLDSCWRYFLFLSDSTKRKLEAEVDEYSDSFYSDLSVKDIRKVYFGIIICYKILYV